MVATYPRRVATSCLPLLASPGSFKVATSLVALGPRGQKSAHKAASHSINGLVARPPVKHMHVFICPRLCRRQLHFPVSLPAICPVLISTFSRARSQRGGGGRFDGCRLLESCSTRHSCAARYCAKYMVVINSIYVGMLASQIDVLIRATMH